MWILFHRRYYTSEFKSVPLTPDFRPEYIILHVRKNTPIDSSANTVLKDK